MDFPSRRDADSKEQHDIDKRIAEENDQRLDFILWL